MAKDKVYWTTKDGRKLDIDTMDEKHVRACLKLMVKWKEEERDFEDGRPDWGDLNDDWGDRG